MNLKEGKTLQGGKYRIEDVLGQGGFGITYLALHTTLERKVAIKEFFMSDFCSRDADTAHVTVPSLANKEKVAKCKAKFIKEARNIARLDNPHIIRIHDVFEENDTAYYVMEYIDGQSLKDVLPSGKALTEAVALNYIRQVSEALAEVHANGLLHLDIKPGNVMVDLKGRAVLIDFGVSKRFDDGSGNEQLTTTTMLGYTPGYAPLEQMDQDGSELTPASDIYALGATLYRLLSGETPPAATALARRKHLEPLPESVSPSVRNAVNKAMQIDEEKRPQSIAEFLALLNAPSSAVPEDDVTIHDVDDESTEHTDDTEKNGKTDNNGSAPKVADSKPVVVEPEKKKNKLWLWILIALLGIGVGLSALFMGGEPEGPEPPVVVVSDSDSVQVTVPIVSASMPEVEQEDATAQVAAERVAELQAESLRIAEERRQAEEAELARQEEERKRQEEAERQTVSVSTASRSNKSYTVNGVSFKMVAVNGGTFRMGSANGDSDERPVHDVTLSDYYIGETEVTQELWQAVMGSNPSRFTGNSQRPVETVSWNDCQAFVRKLNELTGGNFRLPTEAEWEYAARGGQKSRGYKYSGSDNIGEVAWYRDNSNSTTHAVKTKSPNELGIYDMSGNVWEWCQDWYGDYSSAAQTNPDGPNSGRNRVFRGGCRDAIARYCRSSDRLNYYPDFEDNVLGLRLALSQ